MKDEEVGISIRYVRKFDRDLGRLITRLDVTGFLAELGEGLAIVVEDWDDDLERCWA